MAEQRELDKHAPRCAGDLRLAQSTRGLAGLLKERRLLPKSSGRPSKSLRQGAALLMVALGEQGHRFIFVCFVFLGFFLMMHFLNFIFNYS